MAVRSPPRDHLAGEGGVGERFAGHEAAPADATREPRFDMTENAVADRRMNSIRADHDIRVDGGAVGEMRDRGAGAGFGARTLGIQMEHAVRQLRNQQGEQIGAVHGQKRRTVTRGDIAGPLRSGDHATAAKAADELFRRLKSDFKRVVFDTEISERLQGVGAEIEARADFAELAGFLVDRDFAAAAIQRQRRRAAAQPTADDGYSRYPCQGNESGSFSQGASLCAGRSTTSPRSSSLNPTLQRSNISGKTALQEIAERPDARCRFCLRFRPNCVSD